MAVLLLAGLCAYHNSFTGVFVMDDISAIHDNPDIRSVVGDSVWSWIVRPVLYRSLAVNYWLGGLNVRGYHAVNLAIHLLAAGTLFGLLRQTLRLPRFRGRYHDSATGLAGVAALLWLVHPLNTQSVTYIVQRAESMMGLFYLLVLYCLVRGASSSHPTRWYVAAITSSALGMGCKQVMVTAPLTALLYDRTFLTGSLGKSLRARWPVYLSLALTWLVLVPELVYTDPARAGAGFRFQSITPLAYALAQPGVILHYLRLSFWPVGLCLDYNDWPGVSHWFDAWPELAAIAVLVLAALVALARGSGFGFLGTAFFLILAPTSSIMPIADLAFEHRMYLSLACLVVSVVLAADAGLRRLQAWWRWSDGQRDLVGATMVAAVALVLTVLTIERNEVYGSEWGMYRDVLAKRPNNARAYAVLGRLAFAAVGEAG
ncbi:MAG: glycosyltransferase family 39 protein [Gemmataceae bacterium]|nr:glycosyltransferase family 39 protein [Gemmataceae bacterium]